MPEEIVLDADCCPPLTGGPVDLGGSQLSVWLRVYHQRPGRGPTEAPTRQATRRLRLDGQPLTRELTVGEAWQEVPTLWVERVAFMVLVNAGTARTRQPTKQQAEEAAAKVVEVGIRLPESDSVRPVFALHPGFPLPACLCDAADLRLRCRSGSTQVLLTLIPE